MRVLKMRNSHENIHFIFFSKKRFSLHFSASLKGGTVVRPVFFEFPSDEDTQNLSHQFLWGSALLIVPVIQQVRLTWEILQ